MADTTYQIALDYRLQGVEKALGKTKDLDAASQRVAKSLEWVKRAAMAVGASFVFGKVKSALIDSNRELESMQIGMAAVLGMSLSIPFEKAEPVAARLVEHYRNIAKVSPGTTQDFLQFNNAISGAVLNAGGALGDLKAITAGGVIGGQAFGFRADVAAKDVQQALTGNVTMQTPFIKMLLGNESDIAKFNAMTGPARVQKLREVLEGPALKKAAQKFGESYEGQLSTLKDTAQNTFRAIGAPLFRQLTSWLTQINAWADRNAAKLSAMATTVGNALKTGAQWMVKGFGFVVEHRALFMSLAAGFLAFKGAQAMTGVGGSLGASFLKLATSGNIAALAIGGLAIGITALLANGGPGAGIKRFVEGAMAQRAGMDRVGQLAVLNAALPQFAGQMAASRGAMEANRAIQANRAMWADDMLKKKADDPKPKSMNVTIKRVEVVADDADRFVHSLNRAVGKEIASPSQSRFMPRGNV